MIERMREDRDRLKRLMNSEREALRGDRCRVILLALDGGEAATIAARGPDNDAVMIMDQAGWHVAKALVVPDNITIPLLPPCSPELNPIENLWHWIKSQHSSNGAYDGYDHLMHPVTDARRSLTKKRLRSVCRCDYITPGNGEYPYKRRNLCAARLGRLLETAGPSCCASATHLVSRQSGVRPLRRRSLKPSSSTTTTNTSRRHARAAVKLRISR